MAKVKDGSVGPRIGTSTAIRQLKAAGLETRYGIPTDILNDYKNGRITLQQAVGTSTASIEQRLKDNYASSGDTTPEGLASRGIAAATPMADATTSWGDAAMPWSEGTRGTSPISSSPSWGNAAMPGAPVTSGLGGAPTATAERPWYMNYGNAELMELIRRNPSMAALIPGEVKQSFPNEYFLEHPGEQSILDATRRATFGQGALGTATPSWGDAAMPGAPTTSGLAPIAAPVAGVTQPVAGMPTSGDKTGTIVDIGGMPSLRENGVDVPLPPAHQRAISGAPIGPLVSQGNLPRLANQTRSNFSVSERQAWDTLVNRTGGRAEDADEYAQKLSGMPTSSGAGYSSAPRRRY